MTELKEVRELGEFKIPTGADKKQYTERYVSERNLSTVKAGTVLHSALGFSRLLSAEISAGKITIDCKGKTITAILEEFKKQLAEVADSDFSKGKTAKYWKQYKQFYKDKVKDAESNKRTYSTFR